MDKKKLRLFGYTLAAACVAAGGLMVYRGHSREAGLPNPVSVNEAGDVLPSVDDESQRQDAVDLVATSRAAASSPAGPIPSVAPVSAVGTVATVAALAQAASAPSLGVAEQQVAKASGAVASAEQPVASNDEIEQRLQRLERNVHELIAGLRAQGYLKPASDGHGVSPSEPDSSADVVSGDFKPYAAAGHGAGASGGGSPVLPIRRPVRVAAKPAAPASQPQGPQGELLSIDLWDGRPSAVIGTGVPGDSRVRVMSVGDMQNGVTLKAVDVTAQRATFAVAGRDVQLSVGPANAVR